MVKKNHGSGLPLGTAAKITKLVEGESDRGTILILGAYLDEILSDVIRAACISDEKADQLLEFRQPAGDFSSRILLSTSLGLIHEDEAVGLTALRRIRNSAAHFDKKGKGFDVLFDSDQTIDQVGNLAEAMNLARPPRETAAVKEVFVISCRLLAAKILFRATQIEHPKSPPTIKEIASVIREKLKGTEAGERLTELEKTANEGDFEALSDYFKACIAHVK